MLRENVAANSAVQVNRALWLYSLVLVLVSGASVYVYSHTMRWYFRPVFTEDDQFRDLTNYFAKTAHLYHGSAALGIGKPIYNYPAGAAFVFKALNHTFPGHAAVTYIGFLGMCVLGFAVVAWLAIRRTRVWPSATAAIATTALFGYPAWYDADRCNIEGVAWALAAAGLCFLLRNRYATAAVLIGLAACVKPFPILFLLIMVRRRRYREALFGVATATVVTLAAVFALGPNPLKVYRDLQPGVSRYVSTYVGNLAPPDEARFDHSLLDGLKSAAVIIEMGGIHPHGSTAEIWKLREQPGGFGPVRELARFYPIIAMVGFASVVAVFYRMPLLNQLTALGVAVTLFSPASGDYTLLHLYVPFGALLVFLAREVAERRATLRFGSMLGLAVIYALLFSPSTLLMIYAGDAKLLLLLALLVIAARTPMHSAYFDDAAEARKEGAAPTQDVQGVLCSQLQTAEMRAF